MKVTPAGLRRIVLTLLAGSLSVAIANAQNCNNPNFPLSTTTTTQDRDQMLCQLGITLPALPPRIQDPNAPPNAFPRDPANTEGNWTDPRGHTVVRTAFGLWHTYDSDAGLAGGAVAPLGDYGPFSNPRYTDLDLLKMKNGSPVLTYSDWWTKRRPEILKDVQDELYGHIPDPSLWPSIAWSVGPVTTGTQTVNGVVYQYRQKTITGAIDTSGYPQIRNAPVVSCTLRAPLDKAGTKIPVFIVFGSTTAFQYTAPYGYGVCAYNNAALQPDSGGANLSSYIIGLINKGNWRKPEDWGALEAWSWGISRLIDYFAGDPDVDETKIGVEGHSRYGKATLVTAALDPRVAVAFASCGGALGTAPARRHYGETLEFVGSSTSEYHWVAGNLMKYMGPLHDDGTGSGLVSDGSFMPRKVEDLTVDSESMVALVAPRPIFLNGGTDTPPGNGDAWQDPRGMYLSGLLASPVYQFLGKQGVVVPDGTVFTSGPDEAVGGTPPFDMAFISGDIGYRRHHEGHTDVPDWPTFVQFASRYFNSTIPSYDLTARAAFFRSGYSVNSISHTFSGTVQITNNSALPLNGLLYYVVKNLPTGVTLANSSGTTSDGYPMIALSAGLGSGEVATIPVRFTSAPGFIAPSYTAALYTAVH
jgi:hypothetical protein